MAAAFEVSGLVFSYGSRRVLDGVTFEARAGELIALLGPNGVGKSTLMRCILGFERSWEGAIRIGGVDARSLSARQLAQQVAWIPQSSAQVFDFTVLELVLMGAAPRLGLLAMPGRAERDEALAVLDSLGIAHLAHRGCGHISGGEYQLALLSRALLQNARVFLLDEPTASLDYGNQVTKGTVRFCQHFTAFLRLTKALQKVDTIVPSPLSLVLRHATRALILSDGTLFADGRPEDVMSAKSLSALYGIGVRRYTVGEADGEKVAVCVPMGEELK
jgi:iron complex transport system ATP-binding protein